MATRPPEPRRDEAFWRDFLTNGDANERKARRILKLLPHGPRCTLCAAPFAGAAAPIMRMIGKRPAVQNPTMCTSCFDFMIEHHGGAEIECSILFADVRGSTAMAERMTAAAFRDHLDRFYSVASDVVFGHDGTVDKFVGDEVMALFYPLLSGDAHVRQAVEAALAILRATGHGEPSGPWLPIGAGVHAGIAWVGAVGEGSRTELTAVGDAVNTAARVAAAASAGEVLVTADAAVIAGIDPAQTSRTLELKGKQDPMTVVSLTVGPRQSAGGG